MVDRKGKLGQLQQLHEHIKQVRSHMGTLEKQITELTAVHESLQELENVKEGSDILLQFAGGVFAPATLKSTKELCVNVGAGIVVSKSVQETQHVVKKQIEELHAVHVELQGQFGGLVQTFQALQSDLTEKDDV